MKVNLLFVFSVTLLLATLLTTVMSAPVIAETNTYEKEYIQAEVSQSFQNMLDLWREELYFEMYDQGQQGSQTTLLKSSFAQRMVDLNWKPTLEPVKIISIKVDYRNFIRIKAHIQFEHKSNPDNKVTKEFVFHVILDKNRWKFHLGTFIRAPFSGYDIEEVKEPASATPAATGAP